MKPKSTKYFTQWISDIWDNRFLFWAVMAGFITIFPILYIPGLNDKGSASHLSLLGPRLTLFARSFQPCRHILGMGHRLRGSDLVLRGCRSLEIRQAGLHPPRSEGRLRS